MAITDAAAGAGRLAAVVVREAGGGAGGGAGVVHAVHPAVLVSVITQTLSKFTPNARALPGGSILINLINGVAGWALLLALAGLLIGAALWAIGSHSQNYQQSYTGRRAVLVSGLAALLIGAAPTLIDFFFSTGHGIVNPLPL